jgi:hypothetical protein
MGIHSLEKMLMRHLEPHRYVAPDQVLPVVVYIKYCGFNLWVNVDDDMPLLRSWSQFWCCSYKDLAPTEP